MKQSGFIFILVAACLLAECVPIKNPANDPSLTERVILASGDYRYYVVTAWNGVPAYAGTIEIVDYAGESKDLIIPSEIDGKPVAAVAGIKNKMLNSVTFPGSVTLIRGAFENCRLTRINISEEGKPLTIHSSFNANQLTSITIPARVVELGQSFKENPLTSVTYMGSGIKSIVVGSLDKNSDWLFYSYMLDKKPGTYEQRNNGVYFNGQPAIVPALVFEDSGVFLEAVDGEVKPLMGTGARLWVIHPGKHTLTLRYAMSTVTGPNKATNVTSTGNTQFIGTFESGKRYKLKAVTRGMGAVGTIEYFAEEQAPRNNTGNVSQNNKKN